MYDRLPGLILGYHGCDRSVGESMLAGTLDLEASRNSYDWLGHGIYFWEHNPRRAIQFARLLNANPPPGKPRIMDPWVIGTVIDLGLCLNLLDAQFLEELPVAHKNLQALHQQAGTSMPKNRGLRGSTELLLRHLDCAVIETPHQLRLDANSPSFDSARGVFVEGNPIYPGAAIHRFNHIQVCVRNPTCIKGYFRLREDL